MVAWHLRWKTGFHYTVIWVEFDETWQLDFVNRVFFAYLPRFTRLSWSDWMNSQTMSDVSQLLDFWWIGFAIGRHFLFCNHVCTTELHWGLHKSEKRKHNRIAFNSPLDFSSQSRQLDDLTSALRQRYVNLLHVNKLKLFVVLPELFTCDILQDLHSNDKEIRIYIMLHRRSSSNRLSVQRWNWRKLRWRQIKLWWRSVNQLNEHISDFAELCLSL